MSFQHTYHYLTITDEIRARSLYVIGGGKTSMPAGLAYPPSDHPEHHRFRWHYGRILTEYQLVYVTRGGGSLESRSGGTNSIVAGDLFILFPGEWHRYGPHEATGWDEHWVAFKGSRVSSLIDEMAVSAKHPVLRTDVADLLQREFIRIEEELGDESIGYQNVVAARIELILALATTSSLRAALGTDDAMQVVKRAKTLLIERIDRQVNMESIAGELKVGYSWFRKSFRNLTGISPGEYQQQIRLARAYELLRATNLPVAEVGTRCGFDSAYYFARIFKKKSGMTPTEYRFLHNHPPLPPPGAIRSS